MLCLSRCMSLACGSERTCSRQARDVRFERGAACGLSLLLGLHYWGCRRYDEFSSHFGLLCYQIRNTSPSNVRHALEPRRAREAACGRVLWLKFSTKSCCIPSWPHSSRGLSCSRRRPGSAKAVIEFRVGARRRNRRSANPATPLHTLRSSGATWHPVATRFQPFIRGRRR